MIIKNKLILLFIQAHIRFWQYQIKSDSKDINNVTKDFCLK